MNLIVWAGSGQPEFFSGLVFAGHARPIRSRGRAKTHRVQTGPAGRSRPGYQCSGLLPTLHAVVGGSRQRTVEGGRLAGVEPIGSALEPSLVRLPMPPPAR